MRPTFYQHFKDVPDAARRKALVRLAAAFPVPEPFPADFTFTAQSIRAHVEIRAQPVVQHLQDHRIFYLRVMGGAGNAAFFDEIVTFVAARFLPEIYDLVAGKQATLWADLLIVIAGGAV